MCLHINEAEISTEKILDYFGFTRSIFDVTPNNMGYANTRIGDKLCQVFYTGEEYLSFICSDQTLKYFAAAGPDGFVLSGDDVLAGEWNVTDSGRVYYLDLY